MSHKLIEIMAKLKIDLRPYTGPSPVTSPPSSLSSLSRRLRRRDHVIGWGRWAFWPNVEVASVVFDRIGKVRWWNCGMKRERAMEGTFLFRYMRGCYCPYNNTRLDNSPLFTLIFFKRVNVNRIIIGIEDDII